MRNIKFQGDSFEEFNNWLSQDKKVYQRLVRIIQECRRTPFQGIGKPEPLRGNLTGFWSRRIDEVNRLVYSVADNTITIVSVSGHYNE